MFKPALMLIGLCLTLMGSAAKAQQKALTLRAPEHSFSGLFWDVAFQLGPGVQLDGRRNVLLYSQVRLGGLLAAEPWSGALGVSLHAGGLYRLGLGGQFELSHLSGPFVDLGAAYAAGSSLVTEVAAGYRILGLSYQHRFFEGPSHHALLVVFRLPLGLWLAVRESQPVLAQAPLRQPAADQEGPDELSLAQAKRQRRLAETAVAQGKWVEAEAALRRAQTLAPTFAGLLRLTEVQERRGRFVEALAELARFAPVVPAPVGVDLAKIQERERALRRRTPVLRVSPGSPFPPDAVFLIDDQVCPLAFAGYDCLLNPGSHRVQVRHASELLWERKIDVQEGEVVRLELVPLPAAQ